MLLSTKLLFLLYKKRESLLSVTGRREPVKKKQTETKQKVNLSDSQAKMAKVPLSPRLVFLPPAHSRLTPGEWWYCLLCWDSLRLTSRHGEKDVPVCPVTSQPSRSQSLPSDTAVILPFQKLPVHHKHPPLLCSPPERERRKRGISPSAKRELTALSRLTWHHRRDVPDAALNSPRRGNNTIAARSGREFWKNGKKKLNKNTLDVRFRNWLGIGEFWGQSANRDTT